MHGCEDRAHCFIGGQSGLGGNPGSNNFQKHEQQHFSTPDMPNGAGLKIMRPHWGDLSTHLHLTTLDIHTNRHARKTQEWEAIQNTVPCLCILSSIKTGPALPESPALPNNTCDHRNKAGPRRRTHQHAGPGPHTTRPHRAEHHQIQEALTAATPGVSETRRPPISAIPEGFARRPRQCRQPPWGRWAWMHDLRF